MERFETVLFCCCWHFQDEKNNMASFEMYAKVETLNTQDGKCKEFLTREKLFWALRRAGWCKITGCQKSRWKQWRRAVSLKSPQKREKINKHTPTQVEILPKIPELHSQNCLTNCNDDDLILMHYQKCVSTPIYWLLTCMSNSGTFCEYH